jgi:hypothetical protein
MCVAEISGGQYCNNAWRRFGGRNIDARNPGEGMWRTNEMRSEHIVRPDIVTEPPVSTQQGIIFNTPLPGAIVSSNCLLAHAVLRESQSLRSVMPALA